MKSAWGYTCYPPQMPSWHGTQAQQEQKLLFFDIFIKRVCCQLYIK
jgi:hypothetical protein